MRTALTVVTALASRLTKEAGMRSYLEVPVDKEVKYESTSPPLSTSSFERLLASVPRVPECGADQSRRHETRLILGGMQVRVVEIFNNGLR